MIDLSFIRSQFPALSGDWIYFDNAGGTQTARQVGERISDYLYHSNVQLGASYKISQIAGERVKEPARRWATLINAADPAEIIFGSSTTQLLQNLSRSLSALFQPGDEVIVTDFDHEANIGPWFRMEKEGIRVKTWHINRDTLRPEIADLEKLFTEKTRLVAFSHVTNILGTIHPAAGIISLIHRYGALACVDGVACTPHRLPDVTELDADFYVFSMYKVFGPHYSLLYGKRKHLEKMPGINHYFIGKDDIPYKLQPGNVNFELTYSLLGIVDYFNAIYDRHSGGKAGSERSKVAFVYDLIARHEEELASQLIDFLNSRKKVRVVGENSGDRNKRVPTISFVVEGMKSSDIPFRVDPYRIGIRFGDFYARRLIESLGLSGLDGVVRVSMVHYNSAAEVSSLVRILEKIV